MPAKKPAPKPVKKKKVKEVKIRHILNRDEKKLTDLLAMFEEQFVAKEEAVPAENFGECAKRISECPSGKKGGQLGWFAPGKLEDEFEKAAWRLYPTQVSAVVKGSKGYHLIYLEETRMVEVK
eukprot:TRINITY_DN2293_c1_g5_i1.p2 TRINITY_DN2293_c1_g5~~TRINITY_DN2293_c1_g5_i1.p2  ORF type:complete len:123 (+),score=73.74 TRINITY_DN2293_c1_g5_i1:62-430(+)